MRFARLGIVMMLFWCAAAPADPGPMQVFQTRYYTIHTDLNLDDAREAAIRMTRMFEEYRHRTQGFSGEIHNRLPFYLFKTEADYHDAGGLPGSAGIFTGSALMAVAGEHADDSVWHIVQHEGFHQFARAVIRGDLPTWLNEGIAEYFGESLFTGDGFVSGLIPPSRLRRVQQEIRSGRFKSIKAMMFTGHEQWNRTMSIANYDQAWSMVHFLAHAENGRYQTAFVSFMQLIGRGVQWPTAWKQTFGEADGFEERWKQWWLGLDANPTADLYAQVVASSLNSFLARTAAQGQRFEQFDDFLTAASNGNLKIGQGADQWLPPRLLKEAVEAAGRSHIKWSIEQTPWHGSQIVALLPDDTRITASYVLRGSEAPQTTIDVDDTGTIVRQAHMLIDQGKKDTARVMLQQALRSHPRSQAADEARALLRQTQ